MTQGTMSCAGSPAEINLGENDIVSTGMAEMVNEKRRDKSP